MKSFIPRKTRVTDPFSLSLQAFRQRQRNHTEHIQNEDLKWIEATMNTSFSGTTHDSVTNIQQQARSRHHDFDLNEVKNMINNRSYVCTTVHL